VLTVSDSVMGGSRQDRSGPAVAEALEKAGYRVVRREAVPDERNHIENALVGLCEQARLVVTTGGTGVATRDVTPEATLRVIQREMPGFGELMQQVSLEKVPTAILSRQTAGIRGKSLIVNLPGKPSAIRDCLLAVFPAIPYCIDLIGGPRIETTVAAYRPPGS